MNEALLEEPTLEERAEGRRMVNDRIAEAETLIAALKVAHRPETRRQLAVELEDAATAIGSLVDQEGRSVVSIRG